MKKLTAVIVAITILALVTFLIYREGRLPVNKVNPQVKMFVIKPGEGLSSISRNLSNEGLIRNRIVFYLTVKQLGIEKNIQAGDFRLSTAMTAEEVAKQLTHGTVDSWLRIIEGLRKEEIAEIVAKDFPVTVTEFNSLAKEGYLFPETYLIPKNASAQSIINILTATFDQKYTADFHEKANKLHLTQNQVITLASLVEREGRSPQAKQQIASILLNRMKVGMPLQIDATVQYALGYQPVEKSWWKRDLTQEDLTINSLYNTYKNPGLPPGPICSPGLTSIEAVINADDDTPYLFYITGSDNKMHYAKTYEEHQENIRKYLK